jgi:prepilin signal peptidase PulO-like enzyme (type II secretory pathway)
MSCQHTLSWYELVPLFSYLFLGGRCKNCKARISMQYPLVELITGFLFALLFLKFAHIFVGDFVNFGITYAYYALIFSLFIVVAVYDFKHKIIPDVFSLVLGIFTFGGLFLFDSSGFHVHTPTLALLLSGPVLAAPFAAIWFFSKGAWMGLGDGKLALSLGWMLGLSKALSGVVLSFWMGAIFGIALLVFSKNYKMKSEIPFGPFLVLGTILAFLFELHIFPGL